MRSRGLGPIKGAATPQPCSGDGALSVREQGVGGCVCAGGSTTSSWPGAAGGGKPISTCPTTCLQQPEGSIPVRSRAAAAVNAASSTPQQPTATKKQQSDSRAASQQQQAGSRAASRQAGGSPHRSHGAPPSSPATR